MSAGIFMSKHMDSYFEKNMSAGIFMNEHMDCYFENSAASLPPQLGREGGACRRSLPVGLRRQTR